jgi:hypothetical protein
LQCLDDRLFELVALLWVFWVAVADADHVLSMRITISASCSSLLFVCGSSCLFAGRVLGEWQSCVPDTWSTECCTRP